MLVVVAISHLTQKKVHDRNKRGVTVYVVGNILLSFNNYPPF